MLTLRPSRERGHFNHGWLNTYHSFSFADYFDPEHVHFRALRVINEDFVEPGQGFGTHPHRDMEIVTYVLDGALEHKDSLGNGSIIRPGDGQRMSAGTGILHSEFNPSDTERVHLLQIWMLPEKNGITPGYEQKEFTGDTKRGRWQLLASPDGAEGSVTIHTDVRLYVTKPKAGESLDFALSEGRHAWVQVARGTVTVNGMVLAQGDGLAASNEPKLTLTASEDAEILLFDLA